MNPISEIRWRPSGMIPVAVANCLVLLFAEDTPPMDGSPVLPFESPALIPEPLPHSVSILLEPAHILDQPTLCPQDSAQTDKKTADRAGQRVREATAAAETNSDDPATGAASAFGFDNGVGVLTRPSVAGDQAERERQKLMARAERTTNLEHYNIKVGTIPFRFGSGIEFQFSDNVNLSKTNKVADLSIVPHLEIYGGIRLSKLNTLSIQLGLGYIWHLNRSEFDKTLTNASVGLDSDSGISFDIKVGRFRINLYERPAIPRQQYDLITQRNPLQYSQFTNVAGVTIFWDVNSRLAATVQYNHLNVLSLRSEVENLDQSSDLISASATYRFNDALSIGAQANASFITYKRDFVNESTNYDAGLTLSARTGRNTTFRVIAGYQVGEFGSGGAVSDNTSLNDWHIRLSLTNNINRNLSQSLSIGHESQIGTASNFVEVDYIRHQLSMSFGKSLGLETTLSFDSANESGGTLAQKFKLYQCGIYGYWRMIKKLTLSFGYRFVQRDATASEGILVGALDYVENRVDFGLHINL